MIVAELIARAFYLAQINARGLDAAQSEQGKDGLFFLNILLSNKSVPPSYLPYYEEYIFPMQQGVGDYFVERLAKIDAIGYTLNGIRYGLKRQTVSQFRGSPRALNVQSLPAYYWDRRVNGGMKISFYYLPSQVYQVEITGRFMPEKLTTNNMNDDLDEVFDEYFQAYLMYGLSSLLCQFYGISLPPSVADELKDYEITMRNINKMNTTCRTINPLSRITGINYADANLWRGWVPTQ